MERILLTWLCGWIWMGCSTPASYTIHGVVEGKEEGKVFIMGQQGEGNDTIGVAGLKNGEFTFTGRVKEVMPVYIVVENMLGGKIFLENGCEYQVRFKPKGMPVVEGGGENQQLWQEYLALEQAVAKAHQRIMPLLSEARKAKDTADIRKLETEMHRIRTEANLQKKNFLLTHGNSYFALDVLSKQALGLGAEEVKTRFDLCSDDLKATVPGKYIASLIPKLAKIAVGARVPDFSSLTPAGEKVSLYDIRSKVKLIDFWSSNCGRCREENRKTKPLYEKYHPLGLEIISYSLDKKRELWLDAIARDGITWIQVSDLGKPEAKVVIENYGVWSLPANLLVDENNCVLARNIDSDELGKWLSSLLGH